MVCIVKGIIFHRGARTNGGIGLILPRVFVLNNDKGKDEPDRSVPKSS